MGHFFLEVQKSHAESKLFHREKGLLDCLEFEIRCQVALGVVFHDGTKPGVVDRENIFNLDSEFRLEVEMS